MISQHTAQEKIARSEKRVKDAADRWNAVDLSAISQCLSALEYSATDLSEAVTALKESAVTSRSLVRSNITSLRIAALRLERLVDASAAFLRLAPGLDCDGAGLYQSGGSICCSVLPAGMQGIQG
jgi:hypothetical protein